MTIQKEAHLVILNFLPLHDFNLYLTSFSIDDTRPSKKPTHATIWHFLFWLSSLVWHLKKELEIGCCCFRWRVNASIYQQHRRIQNRKNSPQENFAARKKLFFRQPKRTIREKERKKITLRNAIFVVSFVRRESMQKNSLRSALFWRSNSKKILYFYRDNENKKLNIEWSRRREKEMNTLSWVCHHRKISLNEKYRCQKHCWFRAPHSHHKWYFFWTVQFFSSVDTFSLCWLFVYRWRRKAHNRHLSILQEFFFLIFVTRDGISNCWW